MPGMFVKRSIDEIGAAGRRPLSGTEWSRR
jgi:hypothetical protein